MCVYCEEIARLVACIVENRYYKGRDLHLFGLFYLDVYQLYTIEENKEKEIDRKIKTTENAFKEKRNQLKKKKRKENEKTKNKREIKTTNDESFLSKK